MYLPKTMVKLKKQKGINTKLTQQNTMSYSRYFYKKNSLKCLSVANSKVL